MLFYPEKPRPLHIMSKICHLLGIKITSNPAIPADLYMQFEDATFRHEDDVLAKLKQEHEFINARCNDISKEHVDRVFSKVFGYDMAVDPRKFNGLCVQKSNVNAVHDGKIVDCPRD